MRTPTTLIALLPFLALPAASHAERADREKEIVVAADRSASDDIARVLTLEGNVVVTQGTMRMTAAKITIKEDPQKFKYMVATGSPVTFRQKRDNVDEWIDADAQRTEYDERNDKLHLYNRAHVKTAGNDVTGDYISYDMKRELTEVAGAPPGTKAPENSRVKVIIVPPKRDAGKAPANPPVSLKPDAGKP
jgi:lipopolysaccharide export system protein LptA